MQFKTISYGIEVPEGSSCGFLLPCHLGDSKKYATTFSLIVYDETGKQYILGNMKIGQKNLQPNIFNSMLRIIEAIPNVPSTFTALNEDLFSVGQTEGFYEELMDLPSSLREKILTALNDICYNTDIYDINKDEDVMKESLLVSIGYAGFIKYSSILRGEVMLTSFMFSYPLKYDNNEDTKNQILTFDVNPECFPSTNIHALIGRNGVGKSHILKSIALEQKSAMGASFSRRNTFSKVIHVVFSIFDVDEEYCKNTPTKIILGIAKNTQSKDTQELNGNKYNIQQERSLIKSKDELAEEFLSSIKICAQGARKDRAKRIFKVLDYDDIFKIFDIDSIVQENTSNDYIVRSFKKLSSGHAIVLLVIIQLIENVDEKTLILLDEPESHLHPPLLSAFIRALSELVRIRNAVVVCATHSPVVLQEIPKSNVWKIDRIGTLFKAERPNIETFGENVSVLTREIFGLEVGRTGFHKILQDYVNEGKTYEEILEKLNNQLGFEGKLILSSMLSSREVE